MSAAGAPGGFAPGRLAPVADAFRANFEAGLELGARFTVVQGGEVVLDLWAGSADRAGARPFDAATLTPIFSTTKAIAATLLARLAGEGRLDYAAPVADVWPEFAAADKADVTIGQALSHQAGLCGLREPVPMDVWFDWPAACARVAAEAPLWPPGSSSGYHPTTFGYIAGEIFRRIDGRTMGRALAEDVRTPFGLDLHIGLDASEDGRVAEMRKPPAPPALGELTEPKRLAFLTPWAAPGPRESERWRRAEIPSANGHATAEALARLMGGLAQDGVLAGRRLLESGAARTAARERIAGPDLVIPRTMSWGAGFMRSGADGLYGPNPDAFGHSGWGGSVAFADPDRALGAAYVMNRQSAELIDDARPRRLIAALYAALG